MGLAPLGPGWMPLAERAMERLRPELPGAGAVPPLAAPGVWLPAVSAYLDELVTWNQRTDLTAARSAEELVDLTLADAAIVASGSGAGSFVDVGSGAGAPGLIVGLLRPEVSMVLVEPRDRRVAFLRSVIGRLGVKNVRVERARSDALPDGAWDVALSRATLPAPEWALEGARLARHAFWLFLAREETPAVPDFSVDLDVRYAWPLTGVPRRAVRFLRSVASEPRD